MILRAPTSTLFPYTTLFRSAADRVHAARGDLVRCLEVAVRVGADVHGRGLLVHAHVYAARSEEHTSELQSQFHLVCRLRLEKKKTKISTMSVVGPARGNSRS